MTCPSCGRIAQPGAASCINVSCADYQKPFATEVVQAAQAARRGPLGRVRPLRAVASITAGGAALYTLLTVVDRLLPAPGTNRGVDLFGVALELVGLLAVLVASASFVLWMYRARLNLDALPDARPRWARGWAIGVWFALFVNIYLGGLVVADVARESAGADETARRRVLRLVAVWWIAGVFEFLIGVGWIQLTRDDTSLGVRLFATALLIVSGASFVAMLLSVTRLQERRFAVEQLTA